VGSGGGYLQGFGSSQHLQFVPCNEEIFVAGKRESRESGKSLPMLSKQEKGIFLHGHEHLVGIMSEIIFEKIHILGWL
jgi:hypothetical protein